MAGGIRGIVRSYPELLGLVSSLICIVVFGFFLYVSPFLFTMIQQDIWDWFYEPAELLARPPLSRDVVVVGIDEKTVSALGGIPSVEAWRNTILDVAAHARVVAIDCGIGEGEDSSPVAHVPHNVVFPLFGESAKRENSHYVARSWRPMCLDNTKNPRALFGHTDLIVDEDGVVRALPVTVQVEDDRRLALSLVAAKIASPQSVYFEEGVNTRALILGERVVRLGNGGSFKPYFLSSGSFPYYSFSDVLAGKIELKRFDGKVVVAGLNYEGRGTHYLSPRQKAHPESGLFMQANAINSLLTGAVFAESSRDATLLVLVLLNLLMGYVFARTKVLQSTLLGATGAVLYFAGAMYLFSRHYLIDTVFIPLSLSVNFALTHLFLHGAEVVKRREVEEIFGKYLKPEIVEMLVKSPESALESLRGIKKNISILFCDIRGFTSFCETADSVEVVDILNEMFESVTAAIFSEEGTIDKFIGDSVMALFNAPQDQPDHADRAVRAAIKIVDITQEVGRRRGTNLTFGVGINTGEAVIGNIGSPQRLEYTAIGDSVNLASRLCAIAGPGEILISESTRAELLGRYHIEFAGEREVKGKRNRVRVYRVLGELQQ